MVRFAYADRRVSMRDKRRLMLFVEELIKIEKGVGCRLSYVFCSDSYLHGINVSFLKHDDYTDIITFDLSNDPTFLIEGEIYISVDRVRENAIDLGVSFLQELTRVILHGALHLCGYQDKNKRDKKNMRGMEDKYLSLLGVL